MALSYTIDCDESEKKGKYFSNFYGGALVQSQHLHWHHPYGHWLFIPSGYAFDPTKTKRKETNG